MAGIYFHIPFCKQACNYCDFHFSTSLGTRQALLSKITEEISKRYSYLEGADIDSIYFGGGTPSLLTATELETLFEKLSKYFSWSKNAEITLEANPDDISLNALKDWLSLGINRLSIGLQSFDEAELRWMNRAHTAVASVESVRQAQKAGFNNISIDLMYGSKFQTAEKWKKTLETALSLETQHISSYNLTIEGRNVLAHDLQKGKEPAVNDEFSATLFSIMTEVLQNGGFEHYEISNFALPGHRAIHNSSYWLQQPYLGLGPSAHSFNGHERQWNVRNNQLYIKAFENDTPFFEKEILKKSDLFNEYVLTRLRTVWGCNIEEIAAKFGEDHLTHFFNVAGKQQDFLEESNGVFRLNAEGKLRADGIASAFFLV